MLSYPALTLVYCWALGLESIGAYQVAGLALSMSGALWLTAQVREARPLPAPAEAAPA
jgi:drug/metabolite transporter (DMT)-like permease